MCVCVGGGGGVGVVDVRKRGMLGFPDPEHDQVHQTHQRFKSTSCFITFLATSCVGSKSICLLGLCD